MRISLLSATALGTTLAGLLPVVALAQSASPFDWSGFYVGGGIGLAQQDSSVTASYPNGVQGAGTGFTFLDGDLYYETDGVVSGGLPTAFALTGQGATLGVTVGYNFQHEGFVFGLEGDFSAFGQPSTSASQVSTSGDTTVSVTSELANLATMRGRVGITADRLLLFATAGIATGQTSLSTNFDFVDGGKSATAAGSATGHGIGYVAGLGAEYAANDNVSIKLEGLYYALDGTTATATGAGLDGATPATLSPYSVSSNHSGVIVRSGINFRF